MSEQYTITYDIRLRGIEAQRQALSTFNRDVGRAITSLYTVLHLLRRTSGDEDLDAVIDKLLRLIRILNMTMTAVYTLQAASGGWGLVFAGIGALGTVFTIGDMMGSVM